MNMPERGVYLYAAVPAQTSIAPIAAANDVRLIVAGDLGFVVGVADIAALARINDAESGQGDLAELAQRHDAVVRAVTSVAASVIPFRLGTVLKDDRAVREFAETHSTEVATLLDRLAASAEWGVRVVADSQRLPSKQPQPAATTRPGTAHLERRRQELSDAERLRRDRAKSAAAVAEELRGLAVETTAGPGGGAVVLNESYLLRHTDTTRFLDAAERLSAQLASDNLELRVTGPWPPYSFARLVGGDD